MGIVESFGRASAYELHAPVQREIANTLAARVIRLELPSHPRVLEIGCGTGFLSDALSRYLAPRVWWITDIAPAMVSRVQSRMSGIPNLNFAVMDGENPDIEGPFDLICSSLAFEWFADLARAITRLRSLLGKDGSLIFTTLAGGTFGEWRLAHGASPSGVRDYPTREMLMSLDLEVEIETVTHSAGSAVAFLAGLKAIGANTPRAEHQPLNAGQLRRVLRAFDAQGALASYVVATCVAGPLSR